jgi:perosamine synthetase
MMIPRGTLDIAWRDLLAAAWYCLSPADAWRAQARLEACWSDDGLACLSVRSGFDLLLQTLALPAGSEVLLSAITIPDMVAIIRHHGLVPVPVDLDPLTLSLDHDQLRERITPRTRLILVAHLFGSRMPLDHVATIAREHRLLLIEDCAQAYDGTADRGHPASGVSMWSFGPIKMQTALGGALLCVRDPDLLAQMRQRQATYPPQRRRAFLARIGRFTLLKALSHPLLFSLLVLGCKVVGRDHDRLINGSVRSFAGPHLIERLRHQPCGAQVRLLDRRLRTADPQRIAKRASNLRRALTDEPAIAHPGEQAGRHSYWVLPILSRAPQRLVRVLHAHGFDATRKASSLIAVASADPLQDVPQARDLLDRLVYLPTSPALSEVAITRLRQIVIDTERRSNASLIDPIAITSSLP